MTFPNKIRRLFGAGYKPSSDEQLRTDLLAYALKDALKWEEERANHRSFVVHVKGNLFVSEFLVSSLAYHHPEMSFASSLLRHFNGLVAGGAAYHDGPSKIAPFDVQNPVAMVPVDCSLEKASLGFDVLFWTDKTTAEPDAILEINEDGLKVSLKNGAPSQVYGLDETLKLVLNKKEAHGFPDSLFEQAQAATSWLFNALGLALLEDVRTLPYRQAARVLKEQTLTPRRVKPSALEGEILETARWWDGETDPSTLLLFLRSELPSEERQEIFLNLIKENNGFYHALSMLKAAQNL